jgi:hypothetical protein
LIWKWLPMFLHFLTWYISSESLYVSIHLQLKCGFLKTFHNRLLPYGDSYIVTTVILHKRWEIVRKIYVFCVKNQLLYWGFELMFCGIYILMVCTNTMKYSSFCRVLVFIFFLWVVFCRSLFVLLPFFFWPLYCLSFVL